MALISHNRWLARTWRTSHIDACVPAAAAEARPEAGIVAWGLPLRKRFAGPWLRSHKPLGSGQGRRFDLSPHATLEWSHEAATSLAGLPLDGGGFLKERIVLDRKPETNQWDFELELPAGSRLEFQPPLSPQERASGARRPEAAEGSYALFGPSGEKLGHLLRPFAQDAEGRRAWLALEAEALSPTLARLSIRASWALLEAARYPLVIDPTFGYTSIGASSAEFAGNYCRAFIRSSPATSGLAQSVAVYAYKSPQVNLTLGLYNDSANAPTTLLADTAGGPCQPSAGWTTQALDTTPPVSPGSYYWLGYNAAAGVMLHYDLGTGAREYYAASPYQHGTLPSPFPGSSYVEIRSVSIYCTYAEPPAAKTPWHFFFAKAV